MQGVAQTALFVAAVRARESARADALFEDPLASVLAGEEGRAWLAAIAADFSSHYHPGRFPYLEVRTLFFDDWLRRVVYENGLEQFVLLGAGMDTRAFRLGLPRELRVWELDRPELIAVKEARLGRAGAVATCTRAIVPVDLASEEWPGRLIAAGFAPERPAAWLAEGLLEYLPPPNVHCILERTAHAAAPGSRFAAELISQDHLDDPATRALGERRAARGSPWLFGTNDPSALFADRGWNVDRIVSPREVASSTGRWPRELAPVPNVLPRAFFVTATRGASAGRAAPRG